MPGVCTSCGAADVETNEGDKCTNCSGGGEATAEATAEGGGDATPEAPSAE